MRAQAIEIEEEARIERASAALRVEPASARLRRTGPSLRVIEGGSSKVSSPEKKDKKLLN